VILSAAYALFLYRRIIFGALVKPSLEAIQDLNAREVAILVPLVVITIALGFYPKPVLDVTTPAVAKLVSDTKAAQALEHIHKVAVIPKGAVQ
jgi:NADH-quinone oxidoreductase subunit M